MDILFEETPLSLWKYTANQPNYSKPCVGRDTELAQLQYSLSLSSQKQKTVCITGMRGIGKTHFVRHFLSLLHMAGKKNLYFTVQQTDDTLSRLTRLMLHVDKDVSDEVVRNRVEVLSTSFLLSAYLLKVLGISLRDMEKRALDIVSVDHLDQLETEAISLLISYCIDQGVTAIAIDDLHNLQADHCRFIQKLTYDKSPYLLLLSATNITQFTYLPTWLNSVYHIDLKSFNYDEIAEIANVIVKTNTLLSANQKNVQWQRNIIERSHGHPGILEALLYQEFPSDFSNNFYQVTLSTFQALSIEQRWLLKMLAIMGQFFSIKVIDSLFSEISMNGIVHLHNLVCSGFLCPMSDGYGFRHAFIWEVVKEQMNREEQQKSEIFLQELCSRS